MKHQPAKLATQIKRVNINIKTKRQKDERKSNTVKQSQVETATTTTTTTTAATTTTTTTTMTTRMTTTTMTTTETETTTVTRTTTTTKNTPKRHEKKLSVSHAFLRRFTDPEKSIWPKSTWEGGTDPSETVSNLVHPRSDQSSQFFYLSA